ncbi:AAA family ATPase [Raineyella sp.]|uniref:AbiEi antitoxin N-terminal domain-containing protein n=1 Tax=bioreactor metagenome TaxID=1076179 RepID=A0A644Y3R2_9ZZZZ|nr:AAA family ATPase [Raineyella sp.]MEA5155579.1 AAA family ATPase [Raineyella sp.]
MTNTPHPEPDQLLAKLRNAAWLDRQTFPPIAWHVPGIIPEGMSLIAGSPKAGKSWFSLDVALAVASGGRALGRLSVDQRPVLLLALEDGDRRLQERMRRLTHHTPLPEGLDYLTDVKPGLVVDTIEAWMGDRPNVGPAPLIILDTLGKAMPPSRASDGYASDYAFTAGLKRTVDDWPGAALTAIHHTRKMAATDFLDAVSGTQGIAGAVDSVIVLTRKRNEPNGMVQVTGRDVDEGEYALTFDGQWTLDGADLAAAARAAEEREQTSNLGDDSTRIFQFASGHPAGVTPKQVAEALGMDNKTAGTYLARLAESGRLTKAGRGLYRPPARAVETVESDETEPDEGGISTLSTLSTAPRGGAVACRLHGTDYRPDACHTCEQITGGTAA